MTTADTYLPKPTYDDLVEKLRTLQTDRFTGRIERHQIVELLGEIGGIWPATVQHGHQQSMDVAA